MRKKENVNNCPLTASLHVIGGKWKPLIIYVLNRSHRRFGQLDAMIPNISRKVLTDQLKELMEDGLVIRTSYAEIPPRVEYELTEKGKELIPILDAVSKWGSYLVTEKNMESIFCESTKYQKSEETIA